MKVMNFWETVDAELEYQGKERKDLAKQAGFDVSNIGKGIKNGNIPAADTAVKIARALNVSVEYLVNGEVENKKKDINSTEESFRKFMKYRKLVDKLDSLPESISRPIEVLIEEIKI